MDGLSEGRLNELKSEFSLDDLSKFSVFPYFSTHTEAFSRTDSGIYIALWYEDHVKIVEYVDNGLGWKLGFDSSSETWFLEKWHEGAYTKVWKQGDKHWGESSKNNEKSETKEKWSYSPIEESYEFFHLEENNDYGSKAGKKDGISWKEIWHKKPEDSALEKYWISATAKWGEKEGKTGTKTWSLSWREEENLFEEKSYNKDIDRTWGHVKGKNPEKEWHENWSATEEEKTNDKWWLEGDKKWGVKNIIKGKTEYVEEWEEKGHNKRMTKTYMDGEGHTTRYTEGVGLDYKFTEDYSYDHNENEHKTISNGYSKEGSWESLILKKGTKNYAKHKGEDANGKWEEEWDEDGEHKQAWKKGFSELWGSWEEEWSEDDREKRCKKWGERGEKWSEEWKENDKGKYCRKEQFRDGKKYLQEWKEEFGENSKHLIGKFWEGEIVVKEWDMNAPLYDE